MKSEPSDSNAADRSDHLVIIVHGIRDRNLAWHFVKNELERNGFAVEFAAWSPYFDIFRFLFPMPWFRKWAIRHLHEKIQDAIGYRDPNKISYIAHSFGTYLLCHLLRSEYHIRKTHRIILCGSVLPANFKFPSFMDRYNPPVINEVGTKDFWPLVAKCVTFGYGAIGTYGYGGAPVVDRFHVGAGHGHFANEAFCRKFWVPFLSSSDRAGLVPGDQPPLAGPVKDSFVWIAENVKYILIVAAIWMLFPILASRLCNLEAVGQLHWDDTRSIAFLNVAVTEAIYRTRYQASETGFCPSFAADWPPRITIGREEEALRKLWACKRAGQTSSIARSHGIQTLYDLERLFPQCIQIIKDRHNVVDVIVNRQSGAVREVPLDTTEGAWLACDCNSAVDEQIRQLRLGK